MSYKQRDSHARNAAIRKELQRVHDEAIIKAALDQWYEAFCPGCCLLKSECTCTIKQLSNREKFAR